MKYPEGPLNYTNISSYLSSLNTIRLDLIHSLIEYGLWDGYTEENCKISEISSHIINGDVITITYHDNISTSMINVIYNSNIPIFSVLLNTNGGTINSGNVSQHTLGTTTPLPTDVTKERMIFCGWYDNQELSGQQKTEIESTEIGNKEFWAKWDNRGYVE